MPKNDNPDRAQRILDAAADLIVHYGYDKTTVSDIARRAGVSKGAIYLHFNSKDELFEALLLREMMAYSERWLDRLEADPKGGTIAGMYKNSLYALSNTPFMAALFKQDRRVFGSYLRKPDNFYRTMRDQQQESPRYQFVKLMQDAGAVRQDIEAKIIAHVMDILAYGMVSMDEMMAAAEIPPLEETIEGIAMLMDKALTPADGGNPEAGKAIARQIVEVGRQQIAARQQESEEA